MENILFSINGSIAEIVINRPQALNALNSQTLHQLRGAVNKLAESRDVRVVIVTGAGEKAFAAGADISEMEDKKAVEGREFGRLGQRVFLELENLPQIVIAAVNGFALGGGCELALACDIRLASTRAKFGQPEVNLGVIPGFGGTQRLPRLVGKGIAKELIVTGDIIDAQEAYRIGLVNKIFEPEELMAEARKMAERILSRGPWAVASAKSAINFGLNMDDVSAYNYEAEIFGLCFSTEEQKEGMAAFLEKRKPNFGREKQ